MSTAPELQPLRCQCLTCKAISELVDLKSKDGYHFSPLDHCICEMCAHVRLVMARENSEEAGKSEKPGA